MSILVRKFKVGGVLTDPTSFTCGIVRNDTGAAVVAPGTAGTNTSPGVYQWSWTDPAYGLVYTWSADALYAGSHYTATGIQVGPVSGVNSVSLAEVKTYLRIGSTVTAMDALIQLLLDGAEDFVSDFCGVQFGEVARTDYLDGGSRNLFPFRIPIRHVTSIVNRDNPSFPLLEDTDYFVLNDRITQYSGTYGWLYGTAGGGAMYGAWTGRMKELRERWMEGQGRWKVVYDCGYNLPAATVSDAYPHYPVPGKLKVAVLELVRRLFDNRGGVADESAQGWAVTWLTLHESDLMDLLAPHMRMDV